MTADAVNARRVFTWLWTSGQLAPAHVDACRALGVDVVFNLALPGTPSALAREAELVTAQGLTYLHLPVSWHNPKPQDYHRFVAHLQACHGQNVWLHCAMNMRVSAFLYLYRRLVRGESEVAARYPMSTVWEPTGAWAALLHQVLAESGNPASPPDRIAQDEVVLRPATDADRDVHFTHQADPGAAQMAGVGGREAGEFAMHWRRIHADEATLFRSIEVRGEVVGSAISFLEGGRRKVGYWIGRQHWGRGIATQALAELLKEIHEDTLWADTSSSNVASIRVLYKAGFRAHETIWNVTSLCLRR